MAERKHFSSGGSWEPIVGYSRAIRVGNTIEVAGTCAVDSEGLPYAPGDPYLQTQKCLEIIHGALLHLGGQLQDVVRTRMFVTDISQWPEIGKAHGEVFHEIRPVTTMVEVSKLIDPVFLIEIEVTAVLTS